MWLDVKDFGALGDNSHDDSTAINAAITAAFDAGGGVVALPTGIYLTLSQVVLKTNVTLLGFGRFSAIAPKVGGSTDAISVPNAVVKVNLEGFMVDPSLASGGGCRDNIHIGTGASDVRCRRVWSKSAGRNGIFVDATPVSINDSTCELNGTAGAGSGIWVTGTNSGDPTHIVDCYLYANQQDGITCDTNANETIIVGNEIVNNVGAGVTCNNSSKMTMVVANAFSGNRYGVYVTSTGANYGTTIQGNSFSSVSENAIFVNSQNQTSIVGNTIIDASNGNNGVFAAIRLNTAVLTTVQGNNIRSTTGTNTTYGVQDTSGSTGTVVADNSINSMATGMYTLGAGSFVARGNRKGAGSQSGKVTLAAANPAATVATTEVLAGDTIVLSRITAGGTLGHLSIGAITAGTSFTIVASGNLDTSTVYWELVH